MSLTVLFWNFNSQARDAESIVSRVVAYHRVDLLVLVDCTTRPDDLMRELRTVDAEFERKATPETEFQVFTRFPAAELESYGADPRLEVWRLRRGGLDVLLAAIHFHAAIRTNILSRPSLFNIQRATLVDAETRAGHRRTVLFGDFNMDPFDPAMIDAGTGVGGLPTRTLARIRSTPARPRFYNPLAKRLGIEPSEGPPGSHTYQEGPPGTHYFPNTDEPHNLFWRHYDQVLVRPDVFDIFDDNDFEILTNIPGPDGEPRELIRCTGTHWEMNDCDHLPIIFKLRQPEEHLHG